MDADSSHKEDGNQNSPSLLKLKAIELENKLLVEKQRYILLQSELESSMSISSKHLDLYKDECITLKQKLTALEYDNNLLREKELKYQKTIKKFERMKKNDNELQKEEEVDDINVMEKEGENTQAFVDLGSDSDDDGMKDSPTESDDSLILINSECKTPVKKLKSSSDFIPRNNCVSKQDNHARSGNGYTQLPGNSKLGSPGNGYTQSSGNSKSESPGGRHIGRIPTSEQKHCALQRAEQLQRSIKNPSFVRPMTLSYVSGSYWFTLTRKFCTDNHFPDNDTEMMLERENGVKYAVNYLSKRNAFSGGWGNFAKALRLEIGDVLVFELTASARFKVYIVKAIQEVLTVP